MTSQKRYQYLSKPVFVYIHVSIYQSGNIIVYRDVVGMNTRECALARDISENVSKRKCAYSIAITNSG